MFGTVKQYLSELVPDSRERLISEVVIFITREQSGECDFLLILRNLLLLSLDRSSLALLYIFIFPIFRPFYLIIFLTSDIRHLLENTILMTFHRTIEIRK